MDIFFFSEYILPPDGEKRPCVNSNARSSNELQEERWLCNSMTESLPSIHDSLGSVSVPGKQFN